MRAFIPLAEDPEGEYISACAMFIAQDGNGVVGFTDIDDPYLARLSVDPAHYRRETGRALLRHGLAHGLQALASGDRKEEQKRKVPHFVHHTPRREPRQ